MDERHLQLLRDLDDRGTVTAVATAMHRTPSAVSQQLRVAQRQAGVPLVEPFGRGLRLTQAGRLLAEGAVEVAAALARVQAKLDAMRDAPQGVVTIGALPSAAEVFLPELISGLGATDIELHIDDFDVAEADFSKRTIDHDIVIGHTVSGVSANGGARLHQVALAVEPLDVALPVDHPLARQMALSPQQVVHELWIGVPEGYPFDTVLIAMENICGTSIRRAQRLRDNRVVEAMVAAGHGVALLPRFSTRPRPDIVTRPLIGVGASRQIVALCRPDVAERLAVRTVLQALVAIGQGVGTRMVSG